MYRKPLLFLALMTFLVSTAFSQIKINEFLASNVSVNIDPDYGANSDWVELYNAGETDVNLNGYYITDNLDMPNKWQINQNVSIPSKGFLLIWTDGMATGLHTNFKMSASGEQLALYDPTLVLVDSLTFGVQKINISFGRTPDGSDTWRYFQTPTPAAKNATTAFTGEVENWPLFRQSGGIFNAAVSVEMFTTMGGTIRYTLDGTEPTETSAMYTDAISVEKTTIIRARIFKEGQISGRVVTESYFINEGFDIRNLPVVSIATNPDNFWDAQKGIYVQSFKPDWEIPVNVELFENNGSNNSAFNLLAGIKVNGLYSWQLPQKMLGVYFKKQYGESTLPYRLFYDRNRSTFKDFALRASGSDWSYTLFRDGLVQQACHNYNMKLDNMGFRPSIVYVNGKYLGIHNMREKVDEDFIASNYGLDKGTFDLIENTDFAESGSVDAYNVLLGLQNQDLSVQSNYDAIAEVMDIENFTDLVVTEMFSGNNSIDHNVMAWKPKDSGKWKWVLMDLDRGFGSSTSNLTAFYMSQTVWPFNQLMKNPGYKKYFGTRLANHLYTTYNPIRMKSRIDYHKGLIQAEIPNHVARWLGETSSYGNAMPSVAYWNNEVEKLKTFANARPAVLLADLQNYGFSASAQLSLSVFPANGGTLLFNDMQMSETQWTGSYPKDLDITLKAVNKPGYTFKGWAASTNNTLIAKQSTWKYFDKGTDQGTTWSASGFDDTSWSSGEGKFGYGDTQQTLISYGPSSSSKYITTYFRKNFELTAETRATGSFMINMLCDDGDVVYLNGHEIIRSNMPVGETTYKTLASKSISGTGETAFNSFLIDSTYFVTGTNVLAVEVHQSVANSSDLGFDLELLAQMPDINNLLSTSNEFPLVLSEDRKLTAVYASKGENIIPSTISHNMTLYKAKSPYLVQGDVSIPSNVTLTIEPGVVVLMAPKAGFIVNGNIIARGTAVDRIVFKLNPDYSNESWGALNFINTSDTTWMDYVTVENASRGPVLYNAVAAISGFKTNLDLNHMIMDNVDGNPIAARYSSVHVNNSKFHIKITGDMINIKYGPALIENSEFEGNDKIDTDAIDFDNVNDGVIHNVKIHHMRGANSDGIDLGESPNTRLDSVLISNITDKCISVGLHSIVTVRNSIFMNANLGFGVKDSSRINLEGCTFYGISTPIACYEKILGRSGGNAIVNNSILSNSYDVTYTSDAHSTFNIAHSLSDNDPLAEGHSNVFADPEFNSPVFFDFSLKTNSPARQSGLYNGKPKDMGATPRNIEIEPQMVISEVFYNLNADISRTEFVGLYNPDNIPIDISGYSLSMAVKFVFPEGTVINPGERVFVAKNALAMAKYGNAKVFEWTDGSLANEGEAIRLVSSEGFIMDQVIYKPGAPWPDVSGSDEKVLSLISHELDNHFGENWRTASYADLTGLISKTNGGFVVYPNPTSGSVTIQTGSTSPERLDIFTMTGQKVYSADVQGEIRLDLSKYGSGVFFAKVGKNVEKIVVL